MSVVDRRSWRGVAAASPPRTRVARPIAIPRIDVKAWNRQYPLIIPTILLALAALMYMLQVNEGALAALTLQDLHGKEAQTNGQLAHLVAIWDQERSCDRVCTIAVAKYGMVHPDLTSALWLKVHVPPALPTLPKHQPVHTGAFVWLEKAATTVRKSL
jgi:hypothetical protein